MKDIYLFDEDSPLSKKDYENSEYFDAAKQAFDLRRYLEDRLVDWIICIRLRIEC